MSNKSTISNLLRVLPRTRALEAPTSGPRDLCKFEDQSFPSAVGAICAHTIAKWFSPRGRSFFFPLYVKWVEGMYTIVKVFASRTRRPTRACATLESGKNHLYFPTALGVICA